MYIEFAIEIISLRCVVMGAGGCAASPCISAADGASSR